MDFWTSERQQSRRPQDGAPGSALALARAPGWSPQAWRRDVACPCLGRKAPRSLLRHESESMAPKRLRDEETEPHRSPTST
ncbi:PREDICTED: uncharacterized protein LOC105599136 isoform X3 [Cercocebus atys]|uniref:uncharacterized protein LOC105599136 isoform X3 n=1 Tax=Cercocebus atys TaxID=9531 RepID=UPI0005F3E495|nr:PREDICTED: uncharacterized protein LOC105599136 isoform X3 [Cercocebus atys]